MIQIKNKFSGEIILELATLRGADLQNADLGGADLQGADLQDADLWAANLWAANLRNADLQGADLRDADLWDADLRDANLRDANLRGAAAVITGLRWDVYITNGHIRIGCEAHELKAWENFTDDEISEMSEGALDFWTVNKAWVLATCK